MYSNVIHFRILVLCVVFSCCYADFCFAQKAPRIIGGHPANSSQWPWMAGLAYKGDTVFCGSSLIAKDWVLTAAHCVFNEDPSSIDVIINRANQNSTEGEQLTIDKIIVHPLYDPFTEDHDLALIKLNTPSQYAPIKFLEPYSFQDSAGKQALALGWGNMSESEEVYPDELQQVELSIIDNLSCSLVMYGVTENMLCAGDDINKKDTCQGDSGGPLIVFDTESNSWRLAAITSWGYACAQLYEYGVYTRIQRYAQFISSVICSDIETPDPVSLEINVDGSLVTALWSADNNISGYRLNYAPYPLAEAIYSIDMNKLTEFSIELPANSAFYVAITSYKGNCLSGYSNIEHFIVE